MDRDELAEHTVVTDDGVCLLPAELEVLRHTTDHGVREDMAVIAENDIIVNVSKGINRDVPADLSLGADISQRRDIIFAFIHFHICLFIQLFG